MSALLQTELASTVIYTPQGGSPISTRALVATIEPEAGFGRSRQRREGIVVEMLRAGMTEPSEGATIVHEGRTFEVLSAPLIADPDRLLWQVEAFGVEATWLMQGGVWNDGAPWNDSSSWVDA